MSKRETVSPAKPWLPPVDSRGRRKGEKGLIESVTDSMRAVGNDVVRAVGTVKRRMSQIKQFTRP